MHVRYIYTVRARAIEYVEPRRSIPRASHRQHACSACTQGAGSVRRGGPSVRSLWHADRHGHHCGRDARPHPAPPDQAGRDEGEPSQVHVSSLRLTLQRSHVGTRARIAARALRCWLRCQWHCSYCSRCEYKITPKFFNILYIIINY